MIRLSGACKTYQLGEVLVDVLKGVSFQVDRGEFVAIMGPSGSGKSTLLNILGCLDTLDAGEYLLNGNPIKTASEDELAAIRNRHIGFIFQSFNLIPRIDALRNVELPMIYAGIDPRIREKRAMAALKIVGLQDRAHHVPAQLSGGQQQRVAIARSLVNDPELIIADEPTGALDSQSSEEIMRLFQQLQHSGKTLLMVTHEKEIAAYAQRVVYVRDGVMVNTPSRRAL